MKQARQRPATAADFPAIAEFIVRMNARPEQGCLHCGDSVEAVMKELGELGLPPEQSLLLAFSGEHLVGLVGADLAPDIGRGWLWGPFADLEDPGPLCDALMEAFLAQLPADIQVIDSFLDTRNVMTDLLASRHGFGAPRTVHIYRADRPEAGYLPKPAPEPALAQHLIDLTALHEASFPGTWRSAVEMFREQDDSKALFVRTEADQFAGYVHMEADPIEGTGHIHYLAVTQESRGRGIGRELLQQALDWCFNKHALPAASLTVFDSLPGARALYESSGFRLIESGITLRRTVATPTAGDC